MIELTPAELGEMWQWCQEESPIPGQDKLVDDFRRLILDSLLVRAQLRSERHPRWWVYNAEDYFQVECEKAGITPPKEK